MDTSVWSAILQWILDNIVIVIAVVSIFIEITPIKVTPIRSLLKWIGKYQNIELEKKFEKEISDLKSSFNTEISSLKDTVSDLSDRVEKLEIKQIENRMSEIRWTILQFSNDCNNNEYHSKEEFSYVFTQYDEYKSLKSDGAQDTVIERAKKDIDNAYEKYRAAGRF